MTFEMERGARVGRVLVAGDGVADGVAGAGVVGGLEQARVSIETDRLRRPLAHAALRHRLAVLWRRGTLTRAHVAEVL